MKATLLRLISCSAALFFCLGGAVAVSGQVALVRHAPTLNGMVDGSVQQMSPENVMLYGGAYVTGDLLVPGTPTVNLKNTANYGGTMDSGGAATPVDYQVTLNGNTTLRHVIRRTNPIAFPTVTAPLAPPGTRTVTMNSGGQNAGDFATLRYLTLNGNVGQVAVPPGAYGDFTANGGGGFTLGVAGSAQPALYHFQRLVLNGESELRVVGPVLVTLGSGLTLRNTAGSSANPGWLTLKLFRGDLTLSGAAALYAYVVADGGSVIINGSSRLLGGLVSDRLMLDGNALLRLLAPPPTNQPPVVVITNPANHASFSAPANITVTASASDSDGTIAKVEFFQGSTRIGESTAPPYQFVWSNLAAGTYTLIARATDNVGATAESAAITITATLATNQLPIVALGSPSSEAVYNAPATITLAATASDPDGAIAKVEFYQGSVLPVRLGEVTSTPFEFVWTNVPPGAYTLTAKAYDNVGGTAISAPRSITVQASIPYFTGFERADGYAIGALVGQVGWTAVGGAAITDAVSYRGTQSLLLPPAPTPTQAAHTFPAVTGQNVVFVDWFTRPAAGPTAASAIFAQTASARVALVQSASEGQLWAFDSNGADGGAWRGTRFRPALSSDGRTAEWVRITLREDFGTGKWDLYADGKLIDYDAGSADRTQTAFSRITFIGAAAAASAFDDFFVGFDHPLFANTNKDGIDDAWKIRYGLPTNQAIRYTDPFNKGVPIIQNYLLGLNPTVIDTSGDGLPDAWEIKYGMDPLVNNAAGDLVGDGVSNLTKYLEGRNPTVPAMADLTGTIGLKVYRPR